MLKIQIDDVELEETIQKNYGENTDTLVRDFVSSLKERHIKEDVSVSIEQLNNGKGVPMFQVMEELHDKYS